MTQPMESGPVEFVHLAGHAVRVTSFRRDASGTSMHLVTIARGTRDAGIMREMLARGSFEIEIPGEEPTTVRVEDADIRESGTGQTTITRFGITLTRTDSLPTTASRSLDERVAELERQVSVLMATVEELSRAQR